MPKDLPIDRQIKDLQASKYEIGQETVKGFASRALPALVTFGIGAAAVTGVGLLGLGLLGAMGLGAGAAGITAAFGGALPAMTTIGIAVGGLAATATGIAGAIGEKREKSERNDAIDIQIARLEKEAQSQGLSIAPEPVVERPNPAKSSNVVQNILEQGRQNIERTFSPGQIAQRAAQDLTGQSFQEKIAAERATATFIER